jgi:CBS domain-containing protein
MGGVPPAIHEPVFRYDRSQVIPAAKSILDQGGWCVVERCVDVPRQRWEARILIFDLTPEAVADVVEEELEYEPENDARLAGCDRRTLQPDPNMGACLCYLADTPAPADSSAPAAVRLPTAERRITMLVRDGMNPIVVTVGLDHTLREAARRMTARGVGAAVVLDDQQPGPSIITERDILHSNGVGQSIDAELVRDHVTSDVVYAAAHWSLEQAAAAMVKGGFRHVIVLEGSEVAGILSMRDIVRCWTSDGAACAVT